MLVLNKGFFRGNTCTIELMTFGLGTKALAGTSNKNSVSASKFTIKVSLPYAELPGCAHNRLATLFESL